SHFPPPAIERLGRPEFLAEAGGARTAWDEVLALPPLAGVDHYLALDTTTYLPGDLLVKVDRMSMAHALEVRSPLLDHHPPEIAPQCGIVDQPGELPRRAIRIARVNQHADAADQLRRPVDAGGEQRTATECGLDQCVRRPLVI